MTGRDEQFRVRPGRTRARPSVRAKPFVTQVLIAANRAGGLAPRGGRGRGRGSFGRGRSASLVAGRHLSPMSRNAVVKARVVRAAGRRALAAHVDYLRRDGVTRDGQRGRLFDRGEGEVDGSAFAERCSGDRHHFRFIVSPEDGAKLASLPSFTRDLMADVERDLGTRLDWVAVEHWNTAHPHVHLLARGRADDGRDLVIAPDYVSHGLRARARERLDLELGLRTELDVHRAQEREVEQDRWTKLDRGIVRELADPDGVVDLRPDQGGGTDSLRDLRLGRLRKLERLSLAEPEGPAQWRLSPRIEERLRELGERNDVIKRLNRALRRQGLEHTTGRELVLDGAADRAPVLGRLADRGLDDELTGSAYVAIDAVDGRVHHLRLPTLDAAGDGARGSIVEARWTEPSDGRRSRLLIATRSDLDLAAQIEADGATWLDRQLVSRTPSRLAECGFGQEVREALSRRTERLIERGWAERHPDGVRFEPGLLGKLRDRELEAVGRKLAQDTGLSRWPVQEGDMVAGTLRTRLTLASGRFAMVDDGLGFQLVPWRDDLGRQIGREINGIALPGGGIEWSFDRKRGLGR